MDSARPMCVVCGLRDARALSTTRLAGGTNVTVCGTHALIHERAQQRRLGPASTIDELRTLTRDRRDRSRRGSPGDELGAILAAAFAGERRGGAERRRRA
jgi:hypothetical protein